MRILIDADLLLELFLNRGKVSKEADEIWKLAESRKIEGFITNSGLNKIYFICQELTDKKSVDEIFFSLEKTISICPINQDIIRKACLSNLEDFESALEYTCAKYMEFDGVVTHSLEKFSTSDYNIWSVFELLELCKNQQSENKNSRILEEKEVHYDSLNFKLKELDTALKTKTIEENVYDSDISRKPSLTKWFRCYLRKLLRGKLKLVIGLLGTLSISALFVQEMHFIKGKDISNMSGKIESNYCPDEVLLTENDATKKDTFYFRCLADVPNISSLKRVVYAGSTTWLKLQSEIDKEVHKNFSNLNIIKRNFKDQELSSGEAIKLLLDNGQLSFVESSRPLLKSEYQEATKRGYTLKEVPVAIDEIGIFVHPKLDSKGLTIEQLRDIYTGKLTNWSQVGGPNEKIVPYSHPANSETTNFFKKNVLKIDNFGNNVKYIKTNSEALKEIDEISNKKEIGIYFSSYSDISQQCQVKVIPIFNRNVNTFVLPYKGLMALPDNCLYEQNRIKLNAIERGFYPINRQLFLVIKQDNSVDQEAGETYAKLLLSDEGQNLVEKVGLRPMP